MRARAKAPLPPHQPQLALLVKQAPEGDSGVGGLEALWLGTYGRDERLSFAGKVGTGVALRTRMITVRHTMGDGGREGRVRLSELMEKFSTAMLVTRAADGQLRARPLSFAGERDGRLYFSTSADSPKVAELESDPRVAVTMQDSARYVSVSGTAELSHDPKLIEQLWRESWRVWFPGGKDDPELRLLIVKPAAAEYWDQSGTRGIKYLVEMVKAYAAGTTPASGTSSSDVKVPL